MIKQIYVCECDICGAVVPAKAKNYRNETDYVMPDDWTQGKNLDMCVCPACAAKLNLEHVTKPVQNGFACKYGCPPAVTIKSESDGRL